MYLYFIILSHGEGERESEPYLRIIRCGDSLTIWNSVLKDHPFAVHEVDKHVFA